MRPSLLLLFCLYFFNLSSQNSRPNVLFILTDDQGSLDLNCYGADDLHTPNLDALAASGVRFTQFYVAAPVCSPSRAALLTGRNPHAAGLAGNASSRPGHAGMPSQQVTMAEYFKDMGYTTGHIGKWHLGNTAETRPLGQGFDYSFGHMGGCIDNYSHFFYWDGPNRHDLWENEEEIFPSGQYFPELMVEKAKTFIASQSEAPFFLYFAMNAPHYPLQPAEKWRQYYQNTPMPRRDYAAFLSTQDELIGQLIQFLEEKGLRDNTIIVFMSDHGHSCEDRAFGGGGYAGPYRGAKFSLFEGGIRVPAIISWPEQIPKGKVVGEPCSSMDWLPTLLDITHAAPLLPTLEGESMLSLFNDAKPEERTFFWKQGVQWAVRRGPWKLIGNPMDPSNKYPLDTDKDALFLSNPIMDPSESRNLAADYPEQVEALKALYLQWPYSRPTDIPRVLPPLLNKASTGKAGLQTKPHPKYAAQGAATLIDNQRGSADFSDGHWLGFEAIDMEAVIELPEVMDIVSVKVRCLQNLDSYIFLPKQVSATFSLDGKNYSKPVSVARNPKLEQEPNIVEEFTFEAPGKARFIRIIATNEGTAPAWHKAAGDKVWLFVDEVVVE